MIKKALVIGDIMLDKYIETEPVRISDEAPIMIVKITGDDYILGGAGNTAANLKAMGFDVILQGIIGNDWVGDLIVDLIDQKGIKNSITTILDNDSTLKMRILCKGKQLIRIDSEELSKPIIPLSIDGIDIIVISDYAKGVIGEETVKILKETYNVPIIINGKPKNIKYYTGIDIIIFNKKEADEVLDYLKCIYNPEPNYSDIAAFFTINYIVITKGGEGIEVYDSTELRYKVEANEVEVRDITGAGDTVTAALAFEIVNSGNIEKAIKLANFAGGIKVTKHKTAEISLEELLLNPDDEGRPSTEQQINRFNSERIDG